MPFGKIMRWAGNGERSAGMGQPCAEPEGIADQSADEHRDPQRHRRWRRKLATMSSWQIYPFFNEATSASIKTRTLVDRLRWLGYSAWASVVSDR